MNLLKSFCGLTSLQNGVITIGVADLVLSLRFFNPSGNDLAMISITTAILLLVGALKNIRFLLLPWMIRGIILCIYISLVLFFSPLFDEIIRRVGRAGLSLTAIAISLVAALSLLIYLNLVVYSYFAMLRDKETSETNIRHSNAHHTIVKVSLPLPI